MRTLATLVVVTTALTVALLIAVELAAAGTAEAPELSDDASDCAVPYGNEYLDVQAAWVDAETPESFDVHLQLARWNEAIAEGSGFAVQFVHQDVQWGIVAVYSAVISEGWEFNTGRVTPQLAEGFEKASGSFDAATSTMTVTFPKSIFPHVDTTDTTLHDFQAMSADLRPAYPFFVGEEAGLDGNGRWIVCDEATGTGSYAFTSGQHSAHAHEGASANATATPQDASASGAVAKAEAPVAAPTASEKDTPLGPLALIALAIAVYVAKR